MNNKWILLGLVSLGLLMTSCTSLQTYRMEILKPGLLVLPNWMNSMVVLDHTSKINSDSSNTKLLAESILKSLTKSMTSSGQYTSVRIGEASEFRLPKPNERVMGLLSTDHSLMNPISHVLITLDQLSFKVQQVAPVEYLSNTTYSGLINFNSAWTVYNLIQDTSILRFRIEDDLEFQTSKSIKSIDSIFPEVAEYVANMIAGNLNFRWESTDRRYYYSGSLRMREAAECLEMDSLKRASDLWNAAYEKGLFKSKYRAAFNQVLYMDMLGRQDSASVWLKKAEEAMDQSLFGVSSFDHEMLKWWKEWIVKRKVETDRLKIYFETKANQ